MAEVTELQLRAGSFISTLFADFPLLSSHPGKTGIQREFAPNNGERLSRPC